MAGRETETALHASLLLDGEDRILEGNRDAEVFLEKPLDEVRKVPLQAANPTLYAALRELLAKTRRGRGIEDYALAYKLGKRLVRLNVSIAPYPLEALGSTGSLVNITTTVPKPASEPRRRKPSQLAIPTEEPGLARAFMDRLADPAFLLDREAALVYANQAMCALLGHEPENVVGRPLSFFLAGERAKKNLECLPETVHAAPWRGELEFQRPDGSVSTLSVTVSPWPEGEEAAMLGLGRDSTAEARVRREREDELRRLWYLLECVEPAIVCFTPDQRVTLISRSAENLLGVTRDKAIGARLPELFPTALRGEVTALLERTLAGEEVADARIFLERKRERKALSLHTRPSVAARGKPRESLLLLREVTREVEEEKKAKEAFDFQGHRARVMEVAAGSRGWDDFLEGCLEIMEGILRGEASAAYLLKGKKAAMCASRNLTDEEKRIFSSLRLRPGFERMCGDVEVLTVTVHGGVPREGWDEVVSAVEGADSLVPVLRERRWRKLLVLPFRADGVWGGFLAVAGFDAEEFEVRGRELLPTLAEAVADALRAIGRRSDVPLSSGMEGGAAGRGEAEGRDEGDGDAAIETDEAGREEPPDDPPAVHERTRPERHDYFEVALQTRGLEELPSHLTRGAEEPGKKVIPSARGLNLADVARELREYYGRRGRANDIFLELEEDLPPAHVDRSMLREALMCLLDNAIRYSPPGTPVVLGVERWGDEVLLRVEDQGSGIPQEVLRDLAQGEAPAAGRGKERKAKSLLVCRKYVKAMGGELTFKSRAGEGTVAYIRLPILPFVGEVS